MRIKWSHSIIQYLSYYSVYGIMLFFMLASCSKDDGPITEDDTEEKMDEEEKHENEGVTLDKVSGLAQKGPFLNGSSVTISELDNSYSPTGKDFNTQILDNSGLFELSGIELISNYATTRVDGFYFNEVCGESSVSQITLNGIIDATDISSVNLNVLTHLEKSRVEYLIADGVDLKEAKKQAQNEILKIFNIEADIANSENLDISRASEGDAILIAISSILQGFRSESEFSDIMANIITDIRTDGQINNGSIGSDLLAHAKLLDPESIKLNIENRYADLGNPVVVPKFDQHIDNFISETFFSSSMTVIEYPQNGNNGENVLFIENETFNASSWYSLAANLPNTCITLAIRISKVSGDCNGCWFISNLVDNWNYTDYDFSNDSQTFTSTGATANLDMRIDFLGSGSYLVEYLENNGSNPTRTKTIVVN